MRVCVLKGELFDKSVIRIYLYTVLTPLVLLLLDTLKPYYGFFITTVELSRVSCVVRAALGLGRWGAGTWAEHAKHAQRNTQAGKEQRTIA
jgi:hypothetical protein